MDSSKLRGYIVTALKEFRENGKFNPSSGKKELALTRVEREALNTLGLSTQATRQQILRAYRSLAKRYHPDSGTGSGERIIEVNRAYETLTKKNQ